MTSNPQSLAEMRAYAGQLVKITLDYEDPQATFTGRLLSITNDGEVTYVSEGRACHGWPCLAVTPSD